MGRPVGADDVIDGEPGAVVNDILSTPTGVFAAGSTVNGNRLAAALWYSSDGIHWVAVRNPGPIFFGAGDHVITSLVDIGTIGSSVGAARPHRACWPSVACASARPGSRPRGYRRTAFPGARRRRAFPSTTSRGQPGSPRLCGHRSGRLVVRGRRQPRTPAPLAVHQRPGMVGCGPPAAAARDTDWHLGLAAADGRTTVLVDNLPGQPYVLVRQNGTGTSRVGPPSSAALSPRLGRPVSSAMTANS